MNRRAPNQGCRGQCSKTITWTSNTLGPTHAHHIPSSIHHAFGGFISNTTRVEYASQGVKEERDPTATPRPCCSSALEQGVHMLPRGAHCAADRPRKGVGQTQPMSFQRNTSSESRGRWDRADAWKRWNGELDRGWRAGRNGRGSRCGSGSGWHGSGGGHPWLGVAQGAVRVGWLYNKK